MTQEYKKYPWDKSFYVDKNGATVCEIVNGTGYLVAQVPIHTGSGREQRTRRFADLVAAAPDLLEALVAITDQLERVGDCRKDAPFIEAAREAISKAEGK